MRKAAKPNSFECARTSWKRAAGQEESWDSPQLTVLTYLVYTKYDDRQQADGPRCGAR